MGTARVSIRPAEAAPSTTPALVATLAGRVIGYVFVAGGIIFMFVTHEWIGGLWLAFIGWFLETAATISYRQASFHDALRGSTVRDIMIEDRYLLLAVAPRELSLERLVQDYILRTGRRFFMVTMNDKLEGIVTMRSIKKIPKEQWSTSSVGDIMVTHDKLRTARPDQNALELLEQIEEEKINEVPVVERGKIIGMVTRDNLSHRLRTRAELKM